MRNIDALFRQSLTETLNVRLDDKAWDQASLPVKAGGLGVRRIEDLALPAYLSSSSAAKALVLQIAPSAAEPFGLLFSTALEAWSVSAGNEVDPPIQPSASLQSSWDTPLVTHALKNLLSRASDQDALRLRSVSAEDVGGSEWLGAYPSSVCGTLLTDEEIRIAAGLRIGAPIVSPHPCVDCGAAVTASGTHGLSCLKSRGRFPRHENMKEIVGRALRSAGLPTRLEPLGLCRGTNNKRPDGETLVPWQSGQPLAFDVTCIDSFAPSRQHCQPGVALVQKEAEKRAKYADLRGHLFSPVAVETLGRWGPQSFAFLKELGRRLNSVSGDSRSSSFLRHRLSVAVTRGNCLAVLGSIPGGPVFL